MKINESYIDLCNELEAWKARLEAYKAEIKAIIKLSKLYGPNDISSVDYSSIPVKGSCQMDFVEALRRISIIQSHILIHEEAIIAMEKSKLKIEESLSKLEGLDAKVVYMRDIEKKKLKVIADELGYSYDYVKEISSRNKTHLLPTDM